MISQKVLGFSARMKGQQFTPEPLHGRVYAVAQHVLYPWRGRLRRAVTGHVSTSAAHDRLNWLQSDSCSDI